MTSVRDILVGYTKQLDQTA